MLEVSHLHYSKGGRKLIHDLSFTAVPGRLLCIIGDNGAGKSTLMHMLSGYKMPDAGSIRIQGKELTAYHHTELARMRSVLYQHNPQDIPFDPLLLLDISRYAWRGIQEGPFVLEERKQLLTLCQASHLGDRDMRTLSGGEQQRIHFARAVFQRNLKAPSLMLMDEPFNHLDLKHRHNTMQVLLNLCKRNYTAVIVLHDLQIAMQYADDILLMKDGEMLAFGPVQSVMTEALLLEAFEIPFKVFTSNEYPFRMVFPVVNTVKPLKEKSNPTNHALPVTI